MTVYRPGVMESDPDAKWMIVCDAHGQCVGHRTRALAVSWAADPRAWCTGCLRERPRRSGDA